MDAIRAGKVGDTIVSFVPTQAHINNVSLLELNFTENLLTGFRQAVTFVSLRLETPEIAGIKISYDRMCDLLISLMEVHSLFFSKESTASVGERYMGMKRVALGRTGELNKIQKLISLVDAIVVPYILSKNLEELPETQRKFIQSFKIIKSLFAILYLLRISIVASPIHFLAGIKIVRHFEIRTGKPTTWRERWRNLPSLLVWGLVYSIQFSQWYVSHQDALRPKPSQRVVVPPKLISGDLADPRLCPICRQPRRNPTALLSTGQVFCYACLTAKLDPAAIRTLTRRVVE